MDEVRFQRVREVFTALCDQHNGDRQTTLRALCAGEPDVLVEVQRLLEHADQPRFDFDSAAESVGGVVAQALKDAVSSRSAPTSIGDYRIVRLLGEGGMGVVYLAQQTRPKRMVALKVIRPGFATPSLVKRFELETHVLGRLQHPGIAQVFDAGVADVDGLLQPYLVLEYCDGKPLVAYAREKNLPLRKRLELMSKICGAVHHAHTRGVIHRDLKSANIVVVEHPDGTTHPKILDFGVARVIDDAEPMKQQGTVQGQLVGTLAYMSPEQLRGETGVTDTRSDVYTLGVICSELLTGALPDHLRGCSLTELLRNLDQMPRLFSASMASLPTDVQTIIAKAVQIAPERRYQSAHDFSVDVNRFLAGEPIEARRDSMAYIVRKKVRRYRGLLATVALALITMTWFAMSASQQATENANLARAEREAKEQAEQLQIEAVAAQEAATQRRSESEAVTSFLISLLKMADPDVTQNFDASIRSLLAEASEEVGGSFERFPKAEGEIRGHLGRIYATLGDLELADAHLRRAITIMDSQPGESDPELAAARRTALYGLLWPEVHVQLDLNEPNASDIRLRTERFGRSMLNRLHGPLAESCTRLRAIPRRQTSAADLAVHVEQFTKQAASLMQPQNSGWLLAADQMHLLGLSHRLSQNHAHAAVYFKAALEMYRAALSETHTRVARSLGELTDALLLSGQLDEALSTAEHSRTLLRQMLPAEHWYLSVYDARVARALLLLNRSVPEAVALLHRCHEQISQVRGPSSPLALTLLAELIDHHVKNHDIAQADAIRAKYAMGLARSAVPAMPDELQRALHSKHDAFKANLIELQDALAVKDSPLAEPALNRVLEYCRAVLAPGSDDAAIVSDVLTRLGGPHVPPGTTRSQRVAMLEASRIISEQCPQMHGRKVGGTYWWLADFYEQHGDGELCSKYAELAVQHLRASLPAHDPFLPIAESLAAGGLLFKGQYAQAFELAWESYKKVSAMMGVANINSIIAMGRVVKSAAQNDQLPAVTPRVRRHLQQLVKRPPRAPSALHAGYYIVRVPNLPTDLYQLALELVMAAAENPENAATRRALIGMAYYRLADDRSAIDTLRELSDDEDPPLEAVAFFAMANKRSGELSMAQTGKARFDELFALKKAEQYINMRHLASELNKAFQEE